jgi:protein TonB
MKQLASPGSLRAMIEPPAASLAPAIGSVVGSRTDSRIVLLPHAAPAALPGARPTSDRARRNKASGFLIAACIHLLFLASLLSFSGSAGSLKSASADAIEIELIAEPPGEVVQQAAALAPRPNETELLLPPLAQEALIEEPEQQIVQAREPAPERVVLPLAVPERATPTPPSIVKPEAQAKREPAIAPSPQSSRQGSAAAAGDNSALIDAYKIAVASKIARNKPASDTAASAQGVTLISFTILGNGLIAELKIAKSSGHSALDQAAMAAVGKSSPFAPPPSGMNRKFTVPIRFNAR